MPVGAAKSSLRSGPQPTPRTADVPNDVTLSVEAAFDVSEKLGSGRLGDSRGRADICQRSVGTFVGNCASNLSGRSMYARRERRLPLRARSARPRAAATIRSGATRNPRPTCCGISLTGTVTRPEVRCSANHHSVLQIDPARQRAAIALRGSIRAIARCSRSRRPGWGSVGLGPPSSPSQRVIGVPRRWPSQRFRREPRATSGSDRLTRKAAGRPSRWRKTCGPAGPARDAGRATLPPLILDLMPQRPPYDTVAT